MDGNEETLGYDDYEFSDPAFRGDGEMLTGAEDGNDPGIWLYPRDGSIPHRLVAITWGDARPFDASPTFVGGDRVAFVHGDTIRTVPTSCDSCSLDDAGVLATAAGVDAVAWTSQAIPDPLVGAPTGPGGNDPGQTPGGPRPGGPAQPGGPSVDPAPALTLKAAAKAKLGKVLARGIKVPFVATTTGTLTLRATVTRSLAKKLRVARLVARGTTRITKPGAASVTLRFTKVAKKRLKRARSVPLKLAGTFAGAPIAGSTRLAR